MKPLFNAAQSSQPCDYLQPRHSISADQRPASFRRLVLPTFTWPATVDASVDTVSWHSVAQCGAALGAWVSHLGFVYVARRSDIHSKTLAIHYLPPTSLTTRPRWLEPFRSMQRHLSFELLPDRPTILCRLHLQVSSSSTQVAEITCKRNFEITQLTYHAQSLRGVPGPRNDLSNSGKAR